MPAAAHPRLRAFLLAALVMAADRTSKELAELLLEGRPPVLLWGGLVRLQYVLNPGAFLGLGAALPVGPRFWVLTVGTAVVLAGVAAVVFRETGPPSVLAGWSLVLGGGVSNLVDRVARHGEVVDFLNVGWGGLRTGIFNVADMAITAGSLLLLLTLFTARPPAPP